MFLHSWNWELNCNRSQDGFKIIINVELQSTLNFLLFTLLSDSSHVDIYVAFTEIYCMRYVCRVLSKKVCITFVVLAKREENLFADSLVSNTGNKAVFQPCKPRFKRLWNPVFGFWNSTIVRQTLQSTPAEHFYAVYRWIVTLPCALC